MLIFFLDGLLDVVSSYFDDALFFWADTLLFGTLLRKQGLLPVLSLGLLYQDVGVIHLIVVVLEVHYASHEGVVRILMLFEVALFIVLERHHDGLLEEVGRLHNSISVQFLEALDPLDTIKIESEVSGRL